MEQVWPTPPPRLVAVVDNVRSLHNVGAIFRTADGAGFGGVILCGITGTPPRPEIRKAALGAEEFVPWRYVRSTREALEELSQQGYFIVALEKTDRSRLMWEVELRTPLALVVGHEFHGISDEILELADAVAHLPMHGRKASLNVSVAFGIAAYEIVRRLPGAAALRRDNR